MNSKPLLYDPPLYDWGETSQLPLEAGTRPVAATSTLVRWGKFNLVGAVGIGVQFGGLFLSKGVLHFHYLVATAIAVEIAVLHNFVWHQQFTWADRLRSCTDGEDVRSGRRGAHWIRMERAQGSVLRLWRFHLANGAVSIVGNLVLMKIMVGVAGMNYLAANALAILACSLANFLLSDRWVFDDGSAEC